MLDRDSEAKLRILLNSGSEEGWYFHAESKLSYPHPYDFANDVEALFASIGVLQAHTTKVILSSGEAGHASPTFYSVDLPPRTQGFGDTNDTGSSPSLNLFDGHNGYARPSLSQHGSNRSLSELNCFN